MTARVEKLRDIVFYAPPEICTDRAKAITASYKETDGQPVIIRRAKALKKILENMHIYILKGELIVGNQAFQPKSAPLFPEFGVKWIKDELDTFENRRLDPFLITNEKKKEVHEIIRYWEGKTHQDLCHKRLNEILADDIKKYYNLYSCSINQVLGNLYHTTTGDGHIIADYKKLLDKGLKAVIKTAKDRMASESDKIKINFLEAVVISLEGLINFAQRYSHLAETMAESEKDIKRKLELLSIARICRKVPENPPETFYEVLQSLWFLHLAIQIESNGQSISFGRFDQLLNSYYLNDRSKSILDKEKTVELLECFFLKAMELNKVRDWGSTEFNTGYSMYQTLTLGGLSPEGEDATNELSYLALEATADLKVSEPTTVVRIHKETPEKFFMAAIETLAEHKGGLPAFFNDDVAIPLLLNHNFNSISLEEAIDWAVMGCVEPTVPGKFINSTGGTCTINLAKLFEIALNKGVNPETRISVFKPSVGELKSYKDLWDSYIEQLYFYLDLVPQLMEATCGAYKELSPTPLLSAFISNRIEIAKDIMEGKRENDYNVELIELHGLATTADSLLAMKRAVFEYQKFTSDQIRNMLSSNYETYERERLYLLNRVSKFGNDREEADNIARNIISAIHEKITKLQTPRGGCYGISTQTTTCNVPDGRIVGATPDGRKAGEPLSDNNSPASGADRTGPTAAMKSVASIGHEKVGMGTLYNMKFSPTQFNNVEGREKFINLIKGYFEHGGYHVQFNVISNKLLVEAQKNPEKHRDLIVKVAGYSARFTDLDKLLQDQLIARTIFGDNDR